jgi:hypothetical protein
MLLLRASRPTPIDAEVERVRQHVLNDATTRTRLQQVHLNVV